MMETRAQGAAAGLLVVLLLQGLVFIGESSQTSDEAVHLAAGYSYLTTGDFRLNPEHPPLVKMLAALPLLVLDLDFPGGPLWEAAEEWNIGRLFVHENRVPNDTLLFLGRLPVLGLSLVLGWALFVWGRRLFGPRGALLALALYVLDPNVVAHSGLVTTDLGITLFLFLAVHAFWRWSEAPAPGRLLVAGLMAGGAFASKFTSLWLPPVLVPLALLVLLLGEPVPLRPWSARAPLLVGQGDLRRRAVALLLALAAIALVAAAVVAACYLGHGLPAYLAGLARGLWHTGAGHRAYLMGELSETGWWHYYLLAWAIKTPIGTILLVGASLVALARGRRLRLKDEMFLWVPVLVVTLITCFWKVNIGLRHFLPVYPFLYLAAGRLAMPQRAATSPPAPRPDGGAGAATPGAATPAAAPVVPVAAAAAAAGRRRPALAGWLIGAALAWNAVEAAAIAPHHLAYFNQLIGGPRHGHRYLLDSNLDWGQSARALRRYMSAQRVPILYCAFSGNSDPWYYGVPYQYAPGSGNLEVSKRRPGRVPDGLDRELLAVTPMVLHSVHFSDAVVYDWLRQRRPIAMPGWSYMVFDITGDVEAQAQIAALYVNFRLPELAAYQAEKVLRRDPGNRLARAVLEALAEPAVGTAPPGR